MSDNIGKLREVFASALDIPKEKIVNEIEYNTIPEWDSIAHMQLVAKIEEAFDIMMETDDIIAMSSFGKSVEILKKYGILFI